jgi:hypothetical protein
MGMNFANIYEFINREGQLLSIKILTSYTHTYIHAFTNIQKYMYIYIYVCTVCMYP